MSPTVLDGRLLSWAEVRAEKRSGPRWNAILIGNGASRALWQGFSYSSIYSYAKNKSRLSEGAISLFERSHTENFEYVMHDLLVTSRVLEALGKDHSQIDSIYAHIKEVLAVSVKEVHIPWERARGKLRELYDALTQYEIVFSTNYDLLIYWAINEYGPLPFKDYFWSDGSNFDLRNLEKNGRFQWVYYLHGGLHLEELPSGTARKIVNDGSTVLNQFGISREEGAFPLIVTEGSSENKLKAIQKSAYLSFALTQLAAIKGPLVIFGQSLGNSDDHILAAIKRWPNPRLAVSILPGTDDDIKAKKASFAEKIPNATFDFFDATTHPLGRPALQVAP